MEDASLTGVDRRERPDQRVEACALSLCLVAFFLLLARHFLGLSMADNTLELLHGEAMNRTWFYYWFNWSPLYSLWFRELAHVVPDPLVRYYVSWGFFAAALAVLPSLFRIRAAWAYCAVITVLPLLLIEPFIGQCGSAFLVLGLCMVLRREPSKLFAIGTAFGLSFVVAFIRPEFTYDVFLCAAVLVGYVAVRYARRGPGVAGVRPMLAAALIVGVLLLSGVVLRLSTHSKAKRSGIAVSQHYNLRAAEHSDLAMSGAFWNSDYAALAFKVDPATVRDDTATIGDFVRGNPRLYLRFVLQNLGQAGTIGLLVCWAVVLLCPWMDARFRHLRAASLFTLLVTVPPLAGILLISNRWHYQVMVIPCLLVLGLQMVRVPRLTWPRVAAVVVCGCGLIWLVELRVVPRLDPMQARERRDLFRVECLRAVDEGVAGGSAVVFDGSGTGDVYLRSAATPKDRPKRRTLETEADLTQWPEFEGWVRERHPVWLAVDDSLAAKYGVSAADLDAFLQREMGYRVSPCRVEAGLRVYAKDGGDGGR